MGRQLLGLTLFLAAVLLLRKIWSGKMPCRLQYGLWLLVALRLLMPPVGFENPLWAHGPGALLDRLEHTAAVQEEFEAERPAVPETHRQKGTGLGTVTSKKVPADRHETAVSPGRPIWTLKETAMALWLAGMFVTAAWIVAGNLYFRRRLCRNRMYIGQAEGLKVYVSEVLDTPCLCAGWKPAVYLTPESLASEERYRHVLTHELTHYRHKDHIWCMLRSLCTVIYWFHPLVWMAGRAWVADCEKACDEGTIAALGEAQKTAYGQTLIEMLAQRPLHSKITHCCSGLQEGKKAMKERITLIAGKQKKRIWTAVPALLLTFLLAAATVGCGRQADKTAAKQTETPQSKTEDEQILDGAVLSSSQTDASGVYIWALDLDQTNEGLMLYRDKDVLKLLDGNDPTRPARKWYWNGAQMEELPAV